MFILSKKKGFTLIELLVVIAIIGLLASIVMINLNNARNRAKSAAVRGALSELRAAAEMDYDASTPNTYANVCAADNTPTDTGDFGRIEVNVNANNGTTGVRCYDSATAWCAESNLVTGGEWCVDSNGVSGTTANCAAGNISCL